jgi:hypothetical protein
MKDAEPWSVRAGQGWHRRDWLARNQYLLLAKDRLRPLVGVRKSPRPPQPKSLNYRRGWSFIASSATPLTCLAAAISQSKTQSDHAQGAQMQV